MSVNSTEKEQPFAHNIDALMEHHLDPLFKTEPEWKRASWPLFPNDKKRFLDYWQDKDHEVFYRMLLEEVGTQNNTPVIVNAVEMVREGYAGVSKLDPLITDSDRRYFLDLAAELSINAINERRHRNKSRGTYYGRNPDIQSREISAHPDESIVALRKFQSELSDRVSPTPPHMRK
jgi:hypothetical protein